MKEFTREVFLYRVLTAPVFSVYFFEKGVSRVFKLGLSLIGKFWISWVESFDIRDKRPLMLRLLLGT